MLGVLGQIQTLMCAAPPFSRMMGCPLALLYGPSGSEPDPIESDLHEDGANVVLRGLPGNRSVTLRQIARGRGGTVADGECPELLSDRGEIPPLSFVTSCADD